MINEMEILFENQDFIICRFFFNEKVWIFIKSKKDCRLLQLRGIIMFWSSKIYLYDSENHKEISKIISECAKDYFKTNRLHGLTVFLEGWDFWGGGIPIDLDEIRNQLIHFEA